MKVFVFLIFFTVSSCVKNNYKNPPISNEQAAKTLSARCLDCHQDYQYYKDQDFINKGLIIPGAPFSSPLYATLNGNKSGTLGSMPPKQDLSNEEISSIEDWIKSVKPQTINLTKLEKFKTPKHALSEEAILSRCYGQWVRDRLPSQHPLLLKVKNKVLTGSQACGELLKNAFLNQENKVLKSEGREILKSFQTLHRSFFSELNFYKTDENWGSFELYDPGNLAAFFTYGLFKSDFVFKELFLGKKAFELLRQASHTKRDFLIFPNQDIKTKPLKKKDFQFGSGKEISEGQYPVWNIRGASTGSLIGVSPVPFERDTVPRLVDVRKGLRNVRGQNEFKIDKDIHHSEGGGLLGSPLYFILNLKLETGVMSDGGKRIPRHWVASIFKDFLCRELPVVPLTHSNKYRKKKSKHTFRTGSSCVQCHATLDNLAGLVRNLQINYSVDQGIENFLQTSHIRAVKSTVTSETALLGEGQKDYGYTKPEGRFVFKSSNGILYDRSIESLDQLGEAIIATPDLYRCMTKRYLYFLTGINASMLEDSSAPLIDQYYYTLNVKLAENLMRHQSLHKTVLEICTSGVKQVLEVILPAS
ncbi:MAG: hypothetical protein NXH75_12370 [Halobacteriovoraceae bacterium]|nr:hypothetical protein [Halobacteriovoraceae bacterium]